MSESIVKFWNVEAICGHVGGADKGVVKSFPVMATTAKEAASEVRAMGRVKHHHPDAIRKVVKLTLEEYLIASLKHNFDPYFNVHSKREQRALCSDLDVKDMSELSSRHNSYGGRKVSPRAYALHYCPGEVA